MTRARTGLAAAMAALVLGIGVGPAGAAPNSDPTIGSGTAGDPSVLDVVESVAGGGPGIGVDDLSGTGSIEGASVELPIDGSDPLIVDPDVGPAIGLSLPAQGSASMDDRGAVLDAASPDAAVVARASEGGVQALVVIDGPEASSRFRFEVTVEGEPAELRLDADGGVSIAGADGEPAGRVEPPWAIDDDGRRVPTRYEIDASVIVQVVEHEGATYPVVADPNTCGIATCTYYFGKRATRDIAGSGVTGGFCGLVKVVPYAAVGCVAFASAVIVQANRASNRGMCLKIKYTRTMPVVWWPDIYAGKYCR